MTLQRGFLAADLQLASDFKLQSERLLLLPSRSESTDAEHDSRERLGGVLNARVPNQWPPQPVEDRTSSGGWWDWYIVLHNNDGEEDVLVGLAGVRGWPAVSNSLQFGCTFLEEFREHGYGREAVQVLTDWLLSQPAVERVTADTPTGNAKAVAVLRNVGFSEIDSGEQDLLRFEKKRTTRVHDC